MQELVTMTLLTLWAISAAAVLVTYKQAHKDLDRFSQLTVIISAIILATEILFLLIN